MKSLSRSHHLSANFILKKSRSNLFLKSYNVSAFKIGDFALYEIYFSYLLSLMRLQLNEISNGFDIEIIEFN